jgi:hypothetical protein
MNPKSVMLDVGLKEMSGVEIHEDLGATVKSEAMCSGLVTRYLRGKNFTAVRDPKQNGARGAVFTKDGQFPAKT